MGKSNNIVVVFDGTGPVDNHLYDQNFKNSFCRQIHNDIPGSFYRRGVPGEEEDIFQTIRPMIDRQLNDISSEGRRFITDRTPDVKCTFSDPLGLDKLSGRKIYLIGHSRGGLSCVLLAQELARQQIPVEAMFLFDAVNMTFKSNCDVPLFRLARPSAAAANYIVCRLKERYGGDVPRNVRHCYHAMRDPDFANSYIDHARQLRRRLLEASTQAAVTVQSPGNFRLADAASRKIMDDAQDLKEKYEKAENLANLTRSNRDSLLFNWENCATKAESSLTNFVVSEPKFWGSHGALGGCPWPHDVFPSDIKITAAVKAWMWAHLENHNVFDSANISMLFQAKSPASHIA